MSRLQKKKAFLAKFVKLCRNNAVAEQRNPNYRMPRKKKKRIMRDLGVYGLSRVRLVRKSVKQNGDFSLRIDKNN